LSGIPCPARLKWVKASTAFGKKYKARPPNKKKSHRADQREDHMAAPLTKSLGEFVAGMASRNIPPEAAAIVSMGFTDSIATMIAGREDPVVGATENGLESLKSEGPSRLYFTDKTMASPVAAWVNGAAAHAMDYDDVSMLGHPSAVLMPAILAESEELGSTGKEMVAAYIAGFEVWGELVFREKGSHRTRGWHPTGVFGALAAAAACCVLRRLNAEQCSNAIGTAASQACGLTSNFGSMVKPFHAGHAAFAGIMASRYAAAGMVASEDAIEHTSGFLSAISEKGNYDADTPADHLGTDWHILKRKLSIKRYPVCYGTHRVIDATLDLVEKEPLDANDIERITAHIGKVQDDMVRHRRPTSGLQGKFSFEFTVASSIIAKRVGLRELTDEFVNRDDVQNIISRVERVVTDEYDPKMENYPRYDFIEVTLKNGRTLESEHVARAKGHAENPIGTEELWDKFDDCLSDAFPAEKRRALFDKLQNIENLPNTVTLYQ
jgi:2-methylcitrate dehydratase PrpD